MEELLNQLHWEGTAPAATQTQPCPGVEQSPQPPDTDATTPAAISRNLQHLGTITALRHTSKEDAAQTLALFHPKQVLLGFRRHTRAVSAQKLNGKSEVDRLLFFWRNGGTNPQPRDVRYFSRSKTMRQQYRGA